MQDWADVSGKPTINKLIILINTFAIYIMLYECDTYMT